MLATCNMMIFFSCPVTALKEKDGKKWRIGGKEWLYAAGARFLIVYFQCIRKYKDYTFDYDDLAV